MKKTLIFLTVFLFLLAGVGIAQAASNVTFEWDANSESDLAGYMLYQTQIAGQYIFGDGNQVATITAGTEIVTITNVVDGTYFWVLTAYDNDGNESGPSNEVTADLDTIAPGTPANIVIMIIIKVQ